MCVSSGGQPSVDDTGRFAPWDDTSSAAPFATTSDPTRQKSVAVGTSQSRTGPLARVRLGGLPRWNQA